MLKKKVALVIGGNGGIGIESTSQLLKDKFHVCATYNIKKENLNKLKRIKKYKNSLSTYHLNLLNEKSSLQCLKKILSEHGKIDVIVFTSSKEIKNKKIFDLSYKDFKDHIDIQIRALQLSVQVLSDQIRSQHKTKFIVILTEYCFSSPPKGLSHYITAKYAAMGLSKSISQEFAEFGSTCNMISPGMVETDFLVNLPRKLVEINSLQNPLKRNAKPEDISNLISFLASDKSEYINGANILVNGGKVLF